MKLSSRFTRRAWLVVGLATAVCVLTARGVYVEWTTPTGLDLGKAALDADDPASARRLLDEYLARHPRSGEGHFYAARAARLGGDLVQATAHLDRAAEIEWDAPRIDLERALIEAQSGGLRGVEPALVRYVREDHPDSPNILAILVPAYMADFRWGEADRLSEKWVQLRRESARAWKHRGEILWRLRKKEAAADAFRQAVQLDPGDPQTRLGLARALLEFRQSTTEAAGQLEWLRAADPGNPEVLVLLAVCREGQGLTDEAARLLDQAIADFPSEAKALACRGRLELNRGRPGAALTYLRRAADLDPSDLETLYSLAQCLRQVGSPDEAKAAEERWKRAEADLKRVAELARAISLSPSDPDLRREIGELFLRNGRAQDGLRWLESALRERPDHAPTHRVLADYYEQTGEHELAAYHRSAAEPIRKSNN